MKDEFGFSSYFGKFIFSRWKKMPPGCIVYQGQFAHFRIE